MEIVKFLLTLDVGPADVHAQDADGYTALHNACSKGIVLTDTRSWWLSHPAIVKAIWISFATSASPVVPVTQCLQTMGGRRQESISRAKEVGRH